MTKDEALKMAIEALEACKEALEQPAQECKWCKSSEVNFDLDEYPDNSKDR